MALVRALSKHEGDFEISLGRNQKFHPSMTVGLASVCFEWEYGIPSFSHYVA